MRTVINFLLSLLIIFISSCSSGQNKTGQNIPGIKPADKGKVISGVVCLKDPSVSYALYLPSGYSQERKSPLILAFDPHGSGNLPLEQYKRLAEGYGYIMIGSENSKNGQQINETQAIINSLMEEIVLRYSVDTSRIYVMGFSGGARVASLVALYRGGIKGMIGCGAGFAGSDQPARFRFDYIGMAGNADFNMNELTGLDGQLEQANFRHVLIIFDGKHEWPPAETMEQAFIWNEFCAMKDGQIQKNPGMIGDFKNKMQYQLQKDDQNPGTVKKYADLLLMIRFLDGLTRVDTEKETLAKIATSEEFKKEEIKNSLARNKELQEQQMFSENFYLKDLNWWKKRITDYDLRITNGKDDDDVLMCKRIKGYLSLLAYMKYSSAIASGEHEKADFSLQVYRIVDPENAAKIK